MYIYVTGGWSNKNKDGRHGFINTSVSQPFAGQSSEVDS